MEKEMKNEKFKYCEKCGNKVFMNDLFCEKCGNNLKDDKKDIKTSKRRNYTFLYLLGFIIFFFGGAYLMYMFLNTNSSNGNIIVDKLLKEVTVIDNGISEAVDKVYDSVVVIENYQKNTLYATGTGFVYKKDDKNGYILTNNHVIDSADSIYVTFTNGQREKVSIVGSDEYADIALLKIDVSKIISVAFIGDSSSVKIGDTTFAIGAPLDYQVYSWSVTRGIISGKDRLVEVSLSNSNTNDYVMKVLQTDTAINSGNSGGPLCNSNGEVIGITNMKLASSNIEGMGFAIPIETAVFYAESFINGENIIRPYLGIAMYDLKSLKNSFYRYTVNTDLSEGVYITSVEQNSAASKAGIEAGDIITKIDDVDIKSSAYLRYVLYQHKVGDKITITYYRNNKEYKTTVKLESAGKNL